MFRENASTVISKGRTSKKANSLSDLHRRRTETQGQFFTPPFVSCGIWQTLNKPLQAAREMGVPYFSVLDNCVGSGAIFEGAPLKHLKLYGVDIDQRCITALSEDAAKYEIEHDFRQGRLEDLSVSGFHFAVINPPFSIHLESPNLIPYECTRFGRFGPSTSAISHEYALEQALDAAVITAAILPVSMDAYCHKKKTLRAVVYLPVSTFKEECANVNVAVYFFDSERNGKLSVHHLKEGEPWPMIDLGATRLCNKGSEQFRLYGIDESEPTITLPVTGNSRVELHHHNRRIVIKYHCGLVQAKVANGLLMSEAYSKRLPKELRYRGDGALLLDTMLLQAQPSEQLSLLADKISSLGGEAWISPTLAGYYRKLIKRHERAITPFYRAVKKQGGNKLVLKAKRRGLLEPGNFNSPSIAQGEHLDARYKNGDYALTYREITVTLRRDEVLKRFDIINSDGNTSNDEWTVLHKGLNHHFPALSHMYQRVLSASGIDWLERFQRDSLLEGLISPYGYIAGHEQGSGKTRQALALCLLHSGHNMIIVESGLLPEMVKQINELGIPLNLWKVLKGDDRPDAKINITTYSTLRQGSKISVNGKVKIIRTNAQAWRRQLNVVVCDEGSLLANSETQQSRAVKILSARKLIVMDGTPVRNYPRNLLPICVASAGNGVSHQCYGIKGKAFLTQQLINTANHSRRGEDAFYDNHVVTQWVTHQFTQDMQTGGKREIPKINNLSLFREWLNPNIQRRLRSEPDLACFKNCPDPIKATCAINWDKAHLSHYLKVSVEFAQWYKQQNTDSTKQINLISVLARIRAVQRAANSPHVQASSSMGSYTPLTSKQRAALDRIEHWANQGRKVILYAESPDVLSRLHRELAKSGTKSVLFTGKQDINKRAYALDKEFRYGETPVLLSSWVGQRGLNLEQASVVIFYERSWSATVEEQAIYRTQRPSQRHQVEVEYLMLKGSIDDYCAQMVDWKSRAADAGLDFGEQADDDEEFLHLDTLLQEFCNNVLAMNTHEAYRVLAA